VSTSGAVTLAEIADRGGTLEIECADCKRFGRYQIPRLIERYGQKMGQPHLREILAADCPRMRSVSIYERCAARITKPPLRR
jgi:hypothetical protein